MIKTIFYTILLLVIVIPDSEVRIVENDVVDAKQWLMNVWENKVDNVKERMISEEVDRSIREKMLIPADKDAILNRAFNRNDYKNRRERQEEVISGGESR